MYIQWSHQVSPGSVRPSKVDTTSPRTKHLRGKEIRRIYDVTQHVRALKADKQDSFDTLLTIIKKAKMENTLKLDWMKYSNEYKLTSPYSELLKFLGTQAQHSESLVQPGRRQYVPSEQKLCLRRGPRTLLWPRITARYANRHSIPCMRAESFSDSHMMLSLKRSRKKDYVWTVSAKATLQGSALLQSCALNVVALITPFFTWSLKNRAVHQVKDQLHLHQRISVAAPAIILRWRTRRKLYCLWHVN